MRLGSYECTLEPAAMLPTAYGELEISERHRHRYEFNNRYKPVFEEHGMVFTGHHAAGRRRLVETSNCRPSCTRGSLGTQAHPSSSHVRPARRRSIATSSARRSRIRAAAEASRRTLEAASKHH